MPSLFIASRSSARWAQSRNVTSGERCKRGCGLAAIQAKGEWWTANHEVHSWQVAGPWPHDDRFIVGFKFDVTMKPTKQRFTMEEMALYTVKDGKIVREEFFYSMGQ